MKPRRRASIKLIAYFSSEITEVKNSGLIYLKWWKGGKKGEKSVNQEFCIWKKLSLKNGGEIKTLLYKQKLMEYTYPTRNAKGSSSHWNEPDNNWKPYKEVKIFSKDNFLGKYKRQYYCVFAL